MTHRPNEELRWYYQDSAADVGMSAAGLEPIPYMTPESAAPPSEKERRAAERQSRVRRALARLTARQQALLEACYANALDADLGHGAGDGAVHRALREDPAIPELEKRIDDAKAEAKQLHRERLIAHRDQVARDIMGEVKVAHRRYAEIRREHIDGERAAAQRAPTPAQRVAVARHAELPPTIQQRSRSLVAAFVAEIGVDDIPDVRAMLRAERKPS
jgi:hypothetical protein